MKATWTLLIILLPVFTGCRLHEKPEAGQWRAALIPDTTRPALEIPFAMKISYPGGDSILATIINAEEKILVKDIIIRGDSIHFNLPVFEGSIEARVGNKRLEGAYIHRGSGRSWAVPFYADFGITDRFPAFTGSADGNLSGRWEVTVGQGAQAEKQIGEFSQQGSHLTGTFLTTTGDYRYLEGKVAGSRMMLSAFDGAHALVFQADLVPELHG